jgi:molybdenum cofactor biosynthesis protein B
MSVEEHRRNAPKSVRCAIVTISDTRTPETDGSGKFIKEALERAGHGVIGYKIVKDNSNEIRKTVKALIARAEVQAVITSGGTGISRRDVTIEALSPLIEKKLDGFGELFRVLSYQEIGSAAAMSRAMAGVSAGQKVLICLPGSAKAVELAMSKIIINELAHMVWEAGR